MPGLPNKKQQQLVPAPIPAVDGPIEQPRQPQNLQGMLRYAMEASNGAIAAPTQPLSEENRQFLNEAFKSMTVDVIAVLQENIAKLQNVANITTDEVPEKLEAFEGILEYVDNIDIANDFHKINGFSVFEPCLKCAHAEVRAQVCDLIAELAQNNPYIQSVICETTNVVSLLISTLAQDESQQVKVKALYAISCICRESPIGYANFQQHDGLSVLGKVLKSGNDKLVTKTAFLLSALTHMDSKLIDNMLMKGFFEIILAALQTEHQPSHEHLLSLLMLLLEKETVLEAGLQQMVKETVKSHEQFVQGKDEYREEQEYCRKILEIMKP